MSKQSKNLAGMQESLSKMEGSQRSFTNMVILLASFGMLALTIWLYDKGAMGFEGILTCTIAMMGSFGPVVALSSLSNNLNQTLASGCLLYTSSGDRIRLTHRGMDVSNCVLAEFLF